MTESLKEASINSDPTTVTDVPAFPYGDWDETARAFENATSVEYGQAWRNEPETGLLPAIVKIGRHGSTLLFFAELTDNEIYSEAQASGEAIWALGDTFEIFLRPQDREVYYELHVSPQNYDLQLRWPTADTIHGLEDAGLSWEDMKSPYIVMQSWTKVEPENNRWLVLAAIDGQRVAEDNGDAESYDDWLLSFSRYDYSRGQEPVLSSTSPHAVVNFHALHEFGSFSFAK